MHPDEGTLQAFLDDELTVEERRAVEEHLPGCEECRREAARLRVAAADLGAALSLLDVPVPRTAAPPRPAPPRRAATFAALPRAAVLLLGFAAAASATLPGSPVRAWVTGLFESAAPPPAPTVLSAPAPGPVEAPVAAPPVEAGVSVEPVDGQVRVVLRDASPDLVVRAVLTDGGRAGAYATGAAADARFGTGPGRIEVAGAGEGVLRVEIPRAARAATIEVNGALYWTKEGDQLRLAVPAGDSAGAEVTFPVRR